MVQYSYCFWSVYGLHATRCQSTTLSSQLLFNKKLRIRWRLPPSLHKFSTSSVSFIWFPERQFQMIAVMWWYYHSCEHIISSERKLSVYNLLWFTLWHSPLCEDSRAVTSFTGLAHELTLVHTATDIDAWCTVTSHEPCMWESSWAVVRHISTCSVVQRNFLWMEPSAGTGLWWNLVQPSPMKPRTQKSSCLKSVQLLAGLLWKTKRGQMYSKIWVLALSSRQFHLCNFYPLRYTWASHHSLSHSAI